VRQPRIAIVGGGPAGLSAAIAAARSGASTILFDEQPELGGQLRYRIATVPLGHGPRPASVRPSVIRADLMRQAQVAGVDLRPNTLVWGLFTDNVLGLSGPDGADQMTVERVVLATGSSDLPLPFPGGSLPGVFSARALLLLLHVHRVLPGQRFVVIGGSDWAEEIAEAITVAGGAVVARHDPATSSAAVRAYGTTGVQAVTIGDRRYDADIVVIATGRQPDPQLALMAECDLAYRADLGGFVPARDARLVSSARTILVAGDAAGLCEVPLALAEGLLGVLVVRVLTSVALPELHRLGLAKAGA